MNLSDDHSPITEFKIALQNLSRGQYTFLQKCWIKLNVGMRDPNLLRIDGISREIKGFLHQNLHTEINKTI